MWDEKVFVIPIICHSDWFGHPDDPPRRESFFRKRFWTSQNDNKGSTSFICYDGMHQSEVKRNKKNRERTHD